MIRQFITREIHRAFRQPIELFLPLGFCFLVLVLAPLGMGSKESILRPASSGIIWLAVMLASLLTLPGLFAKNHQQGILEQHCLLPVALEWIILGEGLAYWLTRFVPMLAMASLGSILLYFPIVNIGYLMLSLVVGTGAVTFLGLLISALVISSPRAGIAASLFLLPLYIPIIIFCSLASQKPEISPELLFATGIFLISVPAGCWVSAALIRRAM